MPPLHDDDLPTTVPARPDAVHGPSRRRVDVALDDESPAAATDDDRDAAHRLAHVGGAGELTAALLALLLPRGSRRALAAWRLETAGVPTAERWRETVAALSGAARLPWFERLLARMALQPLEARQALLQSARRVMGARGVARPIDRLHWLAMRRGLGEAPPLAARPQPLGTGGDPGGLGGAGGEPWLESDVLAIAAVTAFLSRLVPHAGADGPPHADDPRRDGERWYDDAMAAWPATATRSVPPCRPTSADALVAALQRLQTLSWMQRPQVVRAWLEAALRQPRSGLRRGTPRLDDNAADALALVCGLLDAPLPPAIARHYVTLPADAPAR